MSKRKIVLTQKFLKDLTYWTKKQPRTAIRILNLLEAVVSDPFQGIGKPEPLKYVGADLWSRRITQEHRLVYRVEDTQVLFLECRYHY